jgi:hypothetical protein
VSARAVLGVALLLAACARPDAKSAAEPARLAVDVYGSAATSASAVAPTAVAFQVLSPGATPEDDRVLAEGRTGGDAVPVPAGVVMLAVALDPPERIGPFRLDPGESARVRILDTLDTATSRIWRIERGDEVVGRAFPPPDDFPARSAP